MCAEEKSSASPFRGALSSNHSRTRARNSRSVVGRERVAHLTVHLIASLCHPPVNAACPVVSAATSPPSTSRFTPLTKAAASLPRNASTRATSRGETGRPVALLDGPVDQLVAHRLPEVLEQRRVDRRRAHAVGAHTRAAGSGVTSASCTPAPAPWRRRTAAIPMSCESSHASGRLPVPPRSSTSLIMSRRVGHWPPAIEAVFTIAPPSGIFGSRPSESGRRCEVVDRDHRGGRQGVGDARVVEQHVDRAVDGGDRGHRRRPGRRGRTAGTARAGRSAALRSSTVTCAAPCSARTSRRPAPTPVAPPVTMTRRSRKSSGTGPPNPRKAAIVRSTLDRRQCRVRRGDPSSTTVSPAVRRVRARARRTRPANASGAVRCA